MMIMTCISCGIIDEYSSSICIYAFDESQCECTAVLQDLLFQGPFFGSLFLAQLSCKLAFMGTSHTFRVVRVFTSVKTWEPMRFQYLLFTNLVKSNIECISNIPLLNVRFPSGLLLCEEIQLATWNYLNIGPVESASNKICLPCQCKKAALFALPKVWSPSFSCSTVWWKPTL